VLFRSATGDCISRWGGNGRGSDGGRGGEERVATMACPNRWRRSRWWHEITVSHARATGGGPGVFSWVDEREVSQGRTLGNIDRAENTYSPYPRRPTKKSCSSSSPAVPVGADNRRRRRRRRQHCVVIAPPKPPPTERNRLHTEEKALCHGKISTVELTSSHHEVVHFVVGLVGRGGGGRHAYGTRAARPR